MMFELQLHHGGGMGGKICALGQFPTLADAVTENARIDAAYDVWEKSGADEEVAAFQTAGGTLHLANWEASESVIVDLETGTQYWPTDDAWEKGGMEKPENWAPYPE